MGWGRTLLLGDIGNRLDIADSEREIARLKRTLRNKASIDREQSKEIERLGMYLGALTRLLVAKGVVQANELGGLLDLVD
ncbi:MAG: hypothetical protein O7B99_11475, partial [Planctomycetota bacterium]|nr:hypothetical protein [Planctomycetota bacterium]